MTTADIIQIILSAFATFSAYFVARATSRGEIKKLKAEWNRQDEIARRNTYTAMVQAVLYHIGYNSGTSRKAALDAVAAFQTVCDYETSNVTKLRESLESRDNSDTKKVLNLVEEEWKHNSRPTKR